MTFFKHILPAAAIIVLACRADAGPILTTNETSDTEDSLADWPKLPALEQTVNPSNRLQLSFLALDSETGGEETLSFIAPARNGFSGPGSAVPYSGADWRGVSGGHEQDMLADLEMIDWIGVYLRRAGEISPGYSLDDQMLYVPEPAEIILLAAGVAGLVSAWRRSLRT